MKISASFLSIKDNIKENIVKLTNNDIDYLHLDIMDGKFVANIPWNILEIKNLINYHKPLDVHLMVKDVNKYIDDFKQLHPTYITVHYEVLDDVMAVINYIKKSNIKVGLSIKPNTDISLIIPYLKYIDLVLIMSVEPGLGGQKFIINSVDKIKKLKELKGDFLIEVDGGINDSTINLVKDADIVVVGSYITSGNYEERIKKLKEKIYG